MLLYCQDCGKPRDLVFSKKTFVCRYCLSLNGGEKPPKPPKKGSKNDRPDQD